ncbi:MAG: GTP-binding protein [Symploca sp. SIO2E6]|nr:GTP-binding protein [Symploca sp. SIO2E6]
MATISKKICLIGDFGVGKTSLIRRFVERQFSDQYLSTVGVKISRRTVELTGSKPQKMQLLIWDLEGHTKFKSIAPSYLKGASGAIIVGDVTRQETIDNMPERAKLFSDVNPKGIMICALNKSDLADEEKLAKMHEFQDLEQVITTYKTSAKTGLYVDEIFQKLAYGML